MSMTPVKFQHEAWDLMHYYLKWDRWAFGYSMKGLNTNTVQFINAAYRVYKNVGKNSLGLVLLGDSGIRRQEKSIKNFGLLSQTNSAQEPADTQRINQIDQERKNIQQWRGLVAAGDNPRKISDRISMVKGGQGWENTGDVPDSVWRTGSILNTTSWSALLNDAMILGACEKQFDFAYTVTDDEAGIWRALFPDSTYYAGSFGINDAQHTKEAKEMWIKYFNTNTHALWHDEANVPRVFVRELLGLRRFKYKPVFSKSQLGFVPRDNPGSTTFRNYFSELKKAGYHASNPSKGEIIRNISDYLFGDPGTLHI